MESKQNQFEAACRLGKLEDVNTFLKDSAVNPAANDNSAIRWSARLGYAEVVKVLLADHRVDPTTGKHLPMKWAAQYGCVEVVKVLLDDPRVNPADDRNYSICIAAKNGHVEVVKVLLADPRVDPADFDNYAIEQAAQNGHAEVVKMLIADPRVDPTADDNYTIRKAAKDGHVEVVKVLLDDPRVDPSADNNYALRKATQNNHAKVVKLLKTKHDTEAAAVGSVARHRDAQRSNTGEDFTKIYKSIAKIKGAFEEIAKSVEDPSESADGLVKETEKIENKKIGQSKKQQPASISVSSTAGHRGVQRSNTGGDFAEIYTTIGALKEAYIEISKLTEHQSDEDIAKVTESQPDKNTAKVIEYRSEIEGGLLFWKICGILLLSTTLLLAAGGLIGGLFGVWPDINAFFEAIHLATDWGVGVVVASCVLAYIITNLYGLYKGYQIRTSANLKLSDDEGYTDREIKLDDEKNLETNAEYLSSPLNTGENTARLGNFMPDKEDHSDSSNKYNPN